MVPSHTSVVCSAVYDTWIWGKLQQSQCIDVVFNALEWRQNEGLENRCSVHRTYYFYTKSRDLDKHLNCGGHPVVGLDIWHELTLTECHVSDLCSEMWECCSAVFFIIPVTCGLCFSPGNPNSVMSPASSSQSEEQQYLEKLKQLSKYIEPLRRMINKIDKNEGEVPS